MKNDTAFITDFLNNCLIHIKKSICYEAGCFTTVDSLTLLSTGAFTDARIEKIHPLLFENEYLQKDFNRFENLIKLPVPVGVLSHSTNGNLALSTRSKEILQPAGFSDELRAAVMYKGKCCGFLTLFRSNKQQMFTQKDMDEIISLLQPISIKLYDFFAAPLPPGNTADWDKSVILLNEDMQITAANKGGQSLLDFLRKLEQIDSTILPRPVRAVCTKAKANDLVQTEAKICIHPSAGEFFTIHATLMQSQDQHFAVTCQKTAPQEILHNTASLYRLSDREKQLVNYIFLGNTTKEIAAALYISPHTVQDHLKSIFTKTNSTTRGELVWVLLNKYSFS